VGQKHEKFREFQTPFPPRDIRKNPRSMYARVPQPMAQFALKIEILSHIMGTTPILEMARAYGLRPRLWLLITTVNNVIYKSNIFCLSKKLTCNLSSIARQQSSPAPSEVLP